MNERPTLARVREDRFYRFRLGVGAAIGVVAHLALLAWPLAPQERPATDPTQFQRGLVARAFRPPPPVSPRLAEAAPQAPPPLTEAPPSVPPPTAAAPLPPSQTPPGRDGAPGEPGAPGPRELAPGFSPRDMTEGAAPGRGPSDPSPAAVTPAAQAYAGGAASAGGNPAYGVRQGPPSTATGSGTGEGLEGRASGSGQGKGKAGTGRDQWTAVLADLAARGKNIGRGGGQGGTGGEGGGRGTGGARGSGRGGAKADSPDDFLDPRIRLTVVSYPPSAVERSHPAVPYPDLRIARSQLQAGICRVYYRVWVDESGRIVRTQLKTPDKEEDRKKYAPFIESVTNSVADWPFDRAKLEVHIDALFEIQ